MLLSEALVSLTRRWVAPCGVADAVFAKSNADIGHDSSKHVRTPGRRGLPQQALQQLEWNCSNAAQVKKRAKGDFLKRQAELADRHVLATAIQQSGWSLQWASANPRADRGMVMMAVNNCGQMSLQQEEGMNVHAGLSGHPSQTCAIQSCVLPFEGT